MAVGREILCFENRAKLLAAHITLATGAPSLASKGITAVKTNTGILTVTLDRVYRRLLHASAKVGINGTVTATIADAVQVDARNVTVDGTLILYTAATPAGAAADLADTRCIDLLLVVSDSDV